MPQGSVSVPNGVTLGSVLRMLMARPVGPVLLLWWVVDWWRQVHGSKLVEAVEA